VKFTNYLSLCTTLFLASISAFAQIGTGVSLKRIAEGQTVKLERCGGYAKLSRANDGRLMLYVRGATCSNLRTSKGTWKLNGDAAGERSIDVTFDESVPGDKMVLIGSNSYIDSRGADGNGDYLTVRIASRPVVLNLTRSSQSREINLEHCNGSVAASISSGSVIVKVSNSGCSKFDILSNGSDQIQYEMKNIPEISAEAGYSGSFTIPNRFYDRGSNGILIRLMSPRLVEEKVLIKFQAF
jgi:hypothetical protein